MPRGVPNKRYKPEFKTMVVATMSKEKLSYGKIFEIGNDKRVAPWEHIYLTEGPQGFHVEWRGCGSKGAES